MRFVLILFLFVTSLLSVAQEDSLRKIINSYPSADTVSLSAKIDLGEILSYRNPDSAAIIWRDVLKITDSIIDKKTNDTLILSLNSLAKNNIGWYYKFTGKLDSAILFYKKSIDIDRKLNDLEGVAYTMINIGSIYLQTGEIALAEKYLKESLKINQANQDTTGIAHCYNYLGAILNSKGESDKAIEYYRKSLKLRKENNDNIGVSVVLNNLADIYEKKGDILTALDLHNESLSICEKEKDYQGMIFSLNNIAGIFFAQDDTARALEYYNKSLKIAKQIGDNQSIAYTFVNLGSIYKKAHKFDIALNYFDSSIVIFNKIQDISGLATSYNNIGFIHHKQKNYEQAIKYYTKSLKIWQNIDNKQKTASTYINLANSYYKKGDIKQAEELASKAYNLSKKLGFPEEISQAAYLLSGIYDKLSNVKKSYFYYKQAVTMRDSVFNNNNFKELQKKQARFEYEKKAAIDSIAHIKEIKIKDLEIQKSKEEEAKKTAQLYVVLVGLFLSLILIRVTYKSYRRKRKDAEILAKQKAEIEKIHKRLSDSIDYATKIQASVLPDKKIVDKYFASHFLIYLPKDKVSGDFYWWTEINNSIIIAIADCTGHGVPGAFMSMLGISLMREIILKEKTIRPDIILNKLREEIVKTLHQKGIDDEQKDGMDMSLIIFNKNTKILQFAGANNPIYLIRNEKLKIKDDNTKNAIKLFDNSKLKIHNSKLLYEVKPDKMPIAIYRKMNSFNYVELALSEGDMFYMFTDGFVDQFGGKKGRKFNSKPFKKLILSISGKAGTEQKNILIEEFVKWKNEYPQIDDITIFGAKV